MYSSSPPFQKINPFAAQIIYVYIWSIFNCCKIIYQTAEGRWWCWVMHNTEERGDIGLKKYPLSKPLVLKVIRLMVGFNAEFTYDQNGKRSHWEHSHVELLQWLLKTKKWLCPHKFQPPAHLNCMTVSCIIHFIILKAPHPHKTNEHRCQTFLM